MEPNLLKEEKIEYEQEVFFNSIFCNNYLPFNIYSIKM